MTRYFIRQYLVSVLCICASGVAFMSARAEERASSDDWQYAVSIYLWGAGIKGETASGAEIDVGFDTLISNLNMAFMGAFEARRSEWSLLADVVYLNVGADGTGDVSVPVAPGSNATLKVDADVKTRGWVLNLIGGYSLWQTDQGSLDVLAGARYLELKLDFRLGLESRRFGNPLDVTASGSFWDAVVGVKGHANLTDKWYLPYHLDIGTGESDLTWQASAGVGYRFDWGDLNLLYRHIDWDFGSNKSLEDIEFSGPLLAAKLRF